MPEPRELGDRYPLRLAYWAQRRKLRKLGTPDKLPRLPVGIVIHSGDKGPNVAEWAWRADGQGKYWAHLAWSHVLGKYCQTDYLDAWAPHAGAYNSRTIGIEMPGPYSLRPRPLEQKLAIVQVVRDLKAALPSLQFITGHEYISATKKDPGPGVPADWWQGLGLDVYWTWVGLSLLRKYR